MTDTTVNSGAEDTTQTTQTPADGNTNTTGNTQENTNTTGNVQENTNTTVAPTWRNDWREALAKGDQKTLERLARFPSVDNIWDSYRNLEQKISSQKTTPTLPDKPTPEQLTEYRKAVGVPEKPEGYLEKLPDGLVIGEEDKAAVNILTERLHARNADPAIVADVLDTYYKIVEQNHNDMIEYQTTLKRDSGDALRAEWGPDYRPTINAITATMDGLDPETRELVEGMQLADGSLAFNHSGFMRWMGSLALQINPAAIVVPGNSGGDKQQTVQAEIEANLAEMRKNINAWQHPSNAAKRERHNQLLDAQSKFGKN